MTRRFLVGLVAVIILGAARADAAMMVHFDLAGLLLQSESVVVAERVGPSPMATTRSGRSRYHIVRVLRGPAKVGTDVDVWDSLFEQSATDDKSKVLFLDAKGELVSSGLRVVRGGKVFRFEQWNNPGGWHAVPQGTDPEDNWRPGTPQLDMPGLERAIAAAAKRVDALAAAKLERDRAKRRAAMLALFAPPNGATRGGPGFYTDLLAAEARTFLAANGDVEGALLVLLRDRGGPWRGRDIGDVRELLVIAADTKRDVELRIAALAAGRDRFYEDDASINDVVAFIDDLDPRMRAAAITIAAGLTQISSSDRAIEDRIAKLRSRLAKTLAKLYATETDTMVLATIAAVYSDMWKKPLPARKGGPTVVGVAHVAGQSIQVDVRCLGAAIRATDMKVTATSGGVVTPISTFNAWLHCGTGNGVGGGVYTPLPAGRYDLAIELGTKPAPTKVPLGTLIVDANHDMRVDR
jgi:hypothetical protein